MGEKEQMDQPTESMVEATLEELDSLSLVLRDQESMNWALGAVGAAKEVIRAHQSELARLRAPAAVPEGWISVEDRMPIAGVEVLVAGTNERGQTYFDLCKHHEDEGWLAFDFVADEHSVQTEAPTHWRYIAAPAPSGVSAPAAGVPAESATIAGLEAAVGHLSALVDQQRALLAEVEDVCGRDGHGAPFEDGESELIDRVRAHLAIIAAAPAANAQPNAESDFEHFVQEAIDRAPEPLRRLGEFLASVLDEDRWKTAERMLLGIAAANAQPSELPTWVILHRPGMVPQRKGPFSDKKLIENMLRDLYQLYPDCICDVIDMPHESYPESGREWLAMYGDKRRKPIPAALAHAQSDSAGDATLHGFTLEDLAAITDGLDSYEKTVNVGQVEFDDRDTLLESTTAAAARFIRAAIAASAATKGEQS